MTFFYKSFFSFFFFERKDSLLILLIIPQCGYQQLHNQQCLAEQTLSKQKKGKDNLALWAKACATALLCLTT